MMMLMKMKTNDSDEKTVQLLNWKIFCPPKEEAMQGPTVWNSLPDDLRAQQDCVVQTGLENFAVL